MATGYANLYFQRKDYQNAVELLKWLRKLIQISEHTEDKGFDADARGFGALTGTAFDRYDCMLLESIAEAYFFAEEFEKGEEHLTLAIEKAKKMDATPKNKIKSRHLFLNIHLTKLHSFFNNAENFMEFPESKVRNTEDQRLIDSWKRLTTERYTEKRDTFYPDPTSKQYNHHKTV